SMRVVEGCLGKRKITVLRDIGSNNVPFRNEVVPLENLTEKSSPVFLLNQTARYFLRRISLYERHTTRGRWLQNASVTPCTTFYLGTHRKCERLTIRTKTVKVTKKHVEFTSRASQKKC
ncbi:hypothetical protein IscW_ISCW010635, partial [Ixodes scapularis]